MVLYVACLGVRFIAVFIFYSKREISFHNDRLACVLYFGFYQPVSAVKFNARSECLTAQLLKQGYRYHKLRKAFSKCYYRHHELVSKFNVGFNSLLHQCLSEP